MSDIFYAAFTRLSGANRCPILVPPVAGVFSLFFGLADLRVTNYLVLPSRDEIRRRTVRVLAIAEVLAPAGAGNNSAPPRTSGAPSQKRAGSRILLDSIGGGGRTRTYDLRIMRCAFRRAATWIQSLGFGIHDLSWNRVQSVGA